MLAKQLRKILKHVDKDTDIRVLAYGYSQSRMAVFDISHVDHDSLTKVMVIKIDE